MSLQMTMTPSSPALPDNAVLPQGHELVVVHSTWISGFVRAGSLNPCRFCG
jgi:hypothetical protein